MMDRKNIQMYELQHFIKNVYAKETSIDDSTQNALIALFDNRISNSNKFAHDYAQNYIYQKSLGITDNDKKNLEDIMKVLRG